MHTLEPQTVLRDSNFDTFPIQAFDKNEEINQTISRPIGEQYDDDDLEKELAQILAESESTKFISDLLPSIPGASDVDMSGKSFEISIHYFQFLSETYYILAHVQMICYLLIQRGCFIFRNSRPAWRTFS